MPGIDLHAHTTASDGSLGPSQLVALAAEIGLEALGVTDHDTLDGLPEALAAGAERGIEVVPGIELSVTYPHGRFHMLGYFVEHRAGPLAERLLQLQHNRRTRNARMVVRLQELGVPITLDEIAAASGGGQVGRPHMAAVLVKRGVVGSVHEAFSRFLGDGAAAYVPKDRITAEEGIQLIHASGGLAVVAHPTTLGLDDEALAQDMHRMREMGLDGVECYYSDHTPERAAALARMARAAGLAPTGGSDFHGHVHPDVALGHVIGESPAPAQLLDDMKALLGPRGR